MNKTLKFIACFTILASTSVQAQKLSMEQASNEFSSEGAQCIAYYTISMRCFSDRLNDSDRKAFESGLKTAYTATQLGGKNAGMSDKAIEARIMLSMTSQMEDIQNNCVNISILLNQYAKSCQSFVEHPVERLQSLMTRGK